MLYPHNEYILKFIAKETSAQYLREAEVDHLMKQLYPRRPSWLAQMIRRVLQNLGHVLVTVGSRLDARSARAHTEPSSR